MIMRHWCSGYHSTFPTLRPGFDSRMAHCYFSFVPDRKITFKKGNQKKCGSGGVRTHASEETRTWVERLRPLGHWTITLFFFKWILKRHLQDSNLRGQSPADFESASLTSRTRCQHTFEKCRNPITFEFGKTEKVQYDFDLFILTSASMAQLVERSAVNRQVLGSIPSGGVFFSC